MKTAIIGGGFAGLVCAIKAAENNENLITIFERNDVPGKKILMTGNGRCNISNVSADDSSKYMTSDREFLGKLFKEYSYRDVISFFEELGLYTTEKNGLYYPYSNKASTVRDILLQAANKDNINIICNTFIDNIEPVNGKYKIDNTLFDKVIISCGGKAGVYKEQEYNGYKITKKLDIDIEPMHPALCGIKCEGDFKILEKSRTNAALYLYDGSEIIYSEAGEVQFTDYGLSGIPAFNLSLYLNNDIIKNGAYIKADFLPGMSKEALVTLLETKKSKGQDLLLGLVTDELAKFIYKKCGKDDINSIVRALNESEFKVTGLKEYKTAQVMSGGIKLSEINENFECKKYPGLYIIGEALDVTGLCGGYNISFAVLSALKAASVI